jgi:phage terminase large subunit GpA-like protein
MNDEKYTTALVQARCVSYDESLDPRGRWALPCEACGEWRYLQRHHRKYRSRGGRWKPSNVALLCAHCHQQCTDEYLWAMQRGFNVPSHENPAEVPILPWYTNGPVLLDDRGGYRAIGGLIGTRAE